MTTNRPARADRPTTTAAPPSTAPSAQPLLDLGRLFVGIRRRRRLWVSFALLGMIGGGLLAVLLPAPPTAVTQIHVVHEQDQPSDTGSLIRTDAALAATTTVASAALRELGSDQRPEDFVKEYTVTGLTNNVLEISVEGRTEDEAVRRAEALAAAFIADHVGRVQATAAAEAKALLDQRDRVQSDLDKVNDDIAGAEADEIAAQEDDESTQSNAATLDSLYARRAELTSRVSDLSQQAEQAGIGTPRVAAGTQVVDAARPVPTSLLATGATNSVLGLALGLAAGLALAAVSGVVRNEPVLREDIAAHLGASVVAQLPAPRLGAGRLAHGSRAVRERKRVAATLVRLVRAGSAPVSVLELGARRTAAALTVDIATELAADRDVVIVEDPAGRVVADDLPGRDRGEHRIHVVAVDDPSRAGAGGTRIGIGSVAPGTAWTDLTQLGAETLLVVRAGFANTEWLHTVARQLADSRIPVIGVVLVGPDPRDKTDGTLWNGLHTALRGRAEQIRANGFPARTNGSTNGSAPGSANGVHGTVADLPTRRFAPVGPHPRRENEPERSVHDLPTKRFPPVRREGVANNTATSAEDLGRRGTKG